MIVEAIFMSVLDYVEVIKPLNMAYHSALRLITGDSYDTHHCIVYEKVVISGREMK